jgi:hypothetical protein
MEDAREAFVALAARAEEMLWACYYFVPRDPAPLLDAIEGAARAAPTPDVALRLHRARRALAAGGRPFTYIYTALYSANRGAPWFAAGRASPPALLEAKAELGRAVSDLAVDPSRLDRCFTAAFRGLVEADPAAVKQCAALVTLYRRPTICAAILENLLWSAVLLERDRFTGREYCLYYAMDVVRASAGGD